MSNLPSNPNQTFIKNNPHIYGKDSFEKALSEANKPYESHFDDQKVSGQPPKPKTRQKRELSYNPAIVTAFFKENGIPEPEYEYKFHETRKWRFDLAWVEFNDDGKWGGVALEVQGGIFLAGGGGHNRGAAMLKEWQKLNEAAALGWRLIFVQPRDLCTMETVSLIKRALNL